MNQNILQNLIAHAIMQKPMGMMRLCEIQQIEAVCSKMEGYCSIGCGNGYEFPFVKCDNKLGIDVVWLKNPPFQFWSRNLIINNKFNEKVIEELVEWRKDIKGKVFFYTDNGNKVIELKAIAPICKPGDILGTHDFGTEVPFSMIDELEGFRYMDEYDCYLTEHYCLQAFWEKI